ncbi:BACON domain-containing protein [Chitinophaga oryzae]|uniref:BACON domain-containing protein n=1 Tax=Chitinophaga oryzae TaxID=2725414 RepID=A0AAE6ZI83_9BACT|nr:BACON domain-containing protein [Chitinophaga oryzae]QJB33476.1 BACON domain-containing protein [Chitinophaga oryzae]QJB39995.1 BACON domain-containing protein [Chitinophaga oryzae]
MKKYLFNYYTLIAAGILLMVAACRKTEDYRFSTPLAIDARIIRLGAAADTTRFIVYADGDWNLELAAETPWLQLQTTSGHGKSDALVEVTDNSGQLPRAAKLVVKGGGKSDTIVLQQKGLTPALAIMDETAQTIANGGTYKSVINTNVPLDLMTVGYGYDSTGTVNWLSGLQVKDGYLFFKVDTNQLPVARTVMLRLSYLDALGTTTKDSIVIKQQPGMSYEGAVQKDFAYVKQSLANGLVSENIFVEGIVISDKGHPNMAQNLNKPTDKHSLDKTENSIAVYVQSVDGSSGLYFKTKTAGDNIFNFNDRVKIWLKGVTVQQLQNPSRTIVSGIDVHHIMKKDAGTGLLQPREKYMSALTDNDLYTYVKLKDVEISVPSGAFTNINEGYAARMDCYPLNIRDIQGSSMYMLTNLDVLYRRDGRRVPQGSGTVAGIVVHETYDRYGGNIGKYAIRHLKREDIALNEDRANGFSQVLVEWSRFKTEYAATPTETQNPLTPDAGSGRIYQSGKKYLDFTSSGITPTTDYNGLLQEPTTNKGAVSNGGWGCKGWWNAATNAGESWMIEVSTKGISSPLSLQVEGNSDIGGPRNFVAEWSADNAAWNGLGNFTFQDVANWSNTLLTQVAGQKVLNFQLPQAASGQDKLYIRLRVANKTAGTTNAATGGSITATATCRLSHVSLKYNK